MSTVCRDQLLNNCVKELTDCRTPLGVTAPSIYCISNSTIILHHQKQTTKKVRKSIIIYLQYKILVIPKQNLNKNIHVDIVSHSLLDPPHNTKSCIINGAITRIRKIKSTQNMIIIIHMKRQKETCFICGKEASHQENKTWPRITRESIYEKSTDSVAFLLTKLVWQFNNRQNSPISHRIKYQSKALL